MLRYLRFFLVLPLIFTAMAPPVAAQEASANSASADGLLRMMSETDREYYQQTFDYAMQNLRPGKAQEWSAATGSGEIRADAPFATRETVCRNFHERIGVTDRYTMHTEGIGCKRVGEEGWCRLNKGDLLSCALESPDNDIEELGRDVGETLDFTEMKGKSWWERFKFW